MKLICIADTHTREKQLHIPNGDILIYAGDFSEAASFIETKVFLEWFSNQPHQHKILVPGNHDFFLQKKYSEKVKPYLKGVHLLINNAVTINEYHFWGSPNTPLGNKWAFGLDINDMETHWKKIPRKAQIIITHNPPYDILDHTKNNHIGCPYLRREIEKIEPKYHIFGHAHDNYGTITLKNTTYVNATSFDDKFTTANKPIILAL